MFFFISSDAGVEFLLFIVSFKFEGFQKCLCSLLICALTPLKAKIVSVGVEMKPEDGCDIQLRCSFQSAVGLFLIVVFNERPRSSSSDRLPL